MCFLLFCCSPSSVPVSCYSVAVRPMVEKDWDHPLSRACMVWNCLRFLPPLFPFLTEFQPFLKNSSYTTTDVCLGHLFELWSNVHNTSVTILTLFQAYRSLALSTFTLLCNRHHSPCLECFSPSQPETPCLLTPHSSFLLASSPWKPLIDFLPLRIFKNNFLGGRSLGFSIF